MKSLVPDAIEYLHAMSPSPWHTECCVPTRGCGDIHIPDSWHMSLYASTCGGLELTYLWVNPRLRGAGIAGMLVGNLCKWADARRQLLWGWAMPFEAGRGNHVGYSVYDLAAWYAREFGFMPMRQRNEGVICVRIKREPGGTHANP